MRTAVPLIASAMLAIAGIALAFTLTGSPHHQRELAMDERRSELLDDMTRLIVNRYAYHKALPFKLPDELGKRDPETGKAFEYRRLGNDRYQLCAVFDLKGRQCFSRSLARIEN